MELNVAILLIAAGIVIGCLLCYIYLTRTGQQKGGGKAEIKDVPVALVPTAPLQQPPKPKPEQVHVVAQQQKTLQVKHRQEQIQAEKDPPEVNRLKELIRQFEKDSSQWDILLATGDIYRKGAFPRFLPNEELAARIYKVAAMCPNGKVAGMAQSKYIETYDDPILDEDKSGKELPIEYGRRLCEVAEHAIQLTPWHAFEKPMMTKGKSRDAAPLFPPVNTFMDTIFIDTLPRAIRADVLTPTHGAATVQDFAYHTADSQNVHDHGVTRITDKNIQKLKDDIKSDTAPSDNIMEQIRDALLSHNEIAADVKADALHVMEKLTDSKHSAFNISEREALAMVWRKIQTTEDPTLKRNLTETLAKQMSSAIEKGHVVCSSGKITRIMGTLDGVSNEATRPMWVIREELAAKASQIRDEMLDKYGDTDEAVESMRSAFSEAIRKEYVEQLGMSSKIIEPLISEYKEGF